MELLILAVLIGLVPAIIASNKGYSFGGWWLFGPLLFIVALPMAIVMKPNADGRRQCPHCRTWIHREASVCPQCSRDVPPPDPEARSANGRVSYTPRHRPWEDGR